MNADRTVILPIPLFCSTFLESFWAALQRCKESMLILPITGQEEPQINSIYLSEGALSVTENYQC
jgi:hypothetical protein